MVTIPTELTIGLAALAITIVYHVGSHIYKERERKRREEKIDRETREFMRELMALKDCVTKTKYDLTMFMMVYDYITSKYDRGVPSNIRRTAPRRSNNGN